MCMDFQAWTNIFFRPDSSTLGYSPSRYGTAYCGNQSRCSDPLRLGACLKLKTLRKAGSRNANVFPLP